MLTFQLQSRKMCREQWWRPSIPSKGKPVTECLEGQLVSAWSGNLNAELSAFLKIFTRWMRNYSPNYRRKHWLVFIRSWFWIQCWNHWLSMNTNEKTQSLKKALFNTYLAAEMPWSRRWFSQSEAYQLFSRYAKPHNFTKHRTSHCIICDPGNLCSCFYLLQILSKGKMHHLSLQIACHLYWQQSWSLTLCNRSYVVHRSFSCHICTMGKMRRLKHVQFETEK